MAGWEWTPDGKGLKVGERMFAVKPVKPDERDAYLAELAVTNEVYETLLSAREAFANGMAGSYAAAGQRLRELMVELDLAEQSLFKLRESFSAFFDPPGVLEAIGPTKKDREQFVDEVLERLRRDGRAA